MGIMSRLTLSQWMIDVTICDSFNIVTRHFLPPRYTRIVWFLLSQKLSCFVHTVQCVYEIQNIISTLHSHYTAIAPARNISTWWKRRNYQNVNGNFPMLVKGVVAGEVEEEKQGWDDAVVWPLV